MVNQEKLTWFLTSSVAVKTAGTDMNILRTTVPLLMLTLISACGDASVKEFFCESYAEEGSSHYYKQQVVRTSKEQLCVLWPSDALHCANAGTPMTSAWHDLDGQQVRETTSLKWTKDGGVMTIEQEKKTPVDQPSTSEPSAPLLVFEFQKRASGLTVTSGNEHLQPVVYTCKPWTKQAWWQLY